MGVICGRIHEITRITSPSRKFHYMYFTQPIVVQKKCVYALYGELEIKFLSPE